MLSFEDFLSEKPDFKLCDCGIMSTEVPCWDCLETRRKEMRKAKAELEPARVGCVPHNYADVDLSRGEIIARIGFKEPFEKVRPATVSSKKVLFVGRSGSGKTTLAVGLARLTSKPFWFARAEDIPRARKMEQYGRISSAEIALESRSFVVLDDLGTEQADESKYITEALFRRYENNLATWVTTGLSRDQLKDRYGEALSRRILERAAIIVLEKGAKS